jgi:hypothetical protein
MVRLYSENLEETFICSVCSVTTLGCFLLRRHDTNSHYPKMLLKQDAHVTHAQSSCWSSILSKLW